MKRKWQMKTDVNVPQTYTYLEYKRVDVFSYFTSATIIYINFVVYTTVTNVNMQKIRFFWTNIYTNVDS